MCLKRYKSFLKQSKIMAKYCENCGADLKEGAKFCPDCGHEVKVQNNTTSNSNRNIIIALVCIIAILAVAVALSVNLFTPEVPLESRDFEIFRMDVPVGAEFEEFTSVPSYGSIGGFIFLKNVGAYSKEVFMFDVSTMKYHSVADEFEFERREGDVVIYKDRTGETTLHYVIKEIGEYDFGLMGEDTGTMIKMLNSIEITDSTGLSTQSR